MAYDSRNINVLDRRKSTGIGVALPFNAASAFRTVYSTSEQIRYNLINYILTNPRERVFNPRFGLGIRKRLFEQITENTAEEIKQSIKSGIETYFPNIAITKLSVEIPPDDYIIQIAFSYLIKNTNTSDEILLNFSVNG